MPATLTYPGVYIEEIPSGVRTIVGVATSTAAFLGPALRGPINEATTINSFGEFERLFGGVWEKSPLSYAVQDFYLNGGGQAVIVRLAYVPVTVPPATAPTATEMDNGAKSAKITADTLAFEAANGGAWGNNIQIRVEYPPTSAADDVVFDDLANSLNPTLPAASRLTHADLFNLILWDKGTGLIERFNNLTVKESSRRADRIVRGASTLATITTLLPGAVARPAKSADPAAGKTAFNDNATANLWKIVSIPAAPASAPDMGTDGDPLNTPAFIGDGTSTGLHALDKAEFNLLCIPPPTIEADTADSVWTAAALYAEEKRAFLLVDPPTSWSDKAAARTNLPALFQTIGTQGAKYSAVYFPFLQRKDKFGEPKKFVPSGAVAGVIARTDAQRGVWKAPAGLDAGVVGADSLSVNLTQEEQGELNPVGINCLRVLPGAGRVVYGARTLAGNDLLASEWKYVPIRRLALFIEESLFRGTQWVVFEPNDEPLWAQIRSNVGAFMHSLFRQGAFEGGSPQVAYYVRCDDKTTTEYDRNRGVVNIEVGFKPLKPAEFVVIKIQQIAGSIG